MNNAMPFFWTPFFNQGQKWAVGKGYFRHIAFSLLLKLRMMCDTQGTWSYYPVLFTFLWTFLDDQRTDVIPSGFVMCIVRTIAIRKLQEVTDWWMCQRIIVCLPSWISSSDRRNVSDLFSSIRRCRRCPLHVLFREKLWNWFGMFRLSCYSQKIDETSLFDSLKVPTLDELAASVPDFAHSIMTLVRLTTIYTTRKATFKTCVCIGSKI